MAELNSKISKEKLPPQNIEAEKSLLGCLMIDPEAILKVVDFLMPEDFYKDVHQRIYQTMVELFEKKEPIDVLSISSRLQGKKELEEIGGKAYLTSLVNFVPTASHVLNYAKIVQQKRILRDLIGASYEIRAMGYQEAEDVDVLRKRWKKPLKGLMSFQSIKEVYGEFQLASGV